MTQRHGIAKRNPDKADVRVLPAVFFLPMVLGAAFHYLVWPLGFSLPPAVAVRSRKRWGELLWAWLASHSPDWRLRSFAGRAKRQTSGNLPRPSCAPAPTGFPAIRCTWGPCWFTWESDWGRAVSGCLRCFHRPLSLSVYSSSSRRKPTWRGSSVTSTWRTRRRHGDGCEGDARHTGPGQPGAFLTRTKALRRERRHICSTRITRFGSGGTWAAVGMSGSTGFHFASRAAR